MRLYLSSVIFVLLLTTYADWHHEVDDISKKLRCLVCQNETVYESNTFFSQSIKRQIQSSLANGMDQQAIMHDLRNRYTEAILFEPEKKPKNFVLWLLPLFMFVIILYKAYKIIFTDNYS